MTARQIVAGLLEAEPLDSLEGVPDFDDFRQQHFGRNPLNPSREWKLRYQKPTNPKEARALGVNWYIQNGRKHTLATAEPEYGGYPRNSHTMATNRNLRRKSFGYRDVYSTRERNWPSGGTDAHYRRVARARQARDQAAQAEVERRLGADI